MDLLSIEREFQSQGYHLIAGVDEAGRGCLAGPVFAAAVLFAPGTLIEGVDDSKKLSPVKRQEVFHQIVQKSLAWSVASVDAEEIDQINIHKASLKAMSLAVEGLSECPQLLLIDGKFPCGSRLPQKAIIDGDARCHSVAAASILAKVSRDRWISAQEKIYPGFSFSSHKGYGTKKHKFEIKKWGLTPLHRRSFKFKDS